MDFVIQIRDFLWLVITNPIVTGVISAVAHRIPTHFLLLLIPLKEEKEENYHKQIVDALNVWYKKDIKLNEELNFKTIDSLYVSILENWE